jgi:hypothetical protein
MTPEQRDKHVRTIEKIELMERPAKWREIKKFVLELHPELRLSDQEFSEACQELRMKTESKTASSKSGAIRNTMKLPNWLLDAIRKLDPEINVEMSGRNHGHQLLISKQLYTAFPEYRIARNF